MINKELFNAANYLGILNESSLLSLLDKIEDADFAISFPSDYDSVKAEATEDINNIRSYLKSYDIGGYSIIGHWEETLDGTKWENATDEQKIDAIEDSILFVKYDVISREDFISICKDICDKFDQDSILVSLAGKGVYLYNRGGSQQKISATTESILIKKIASGYSQMRGRENALFNFVGILTPMNHISNMSFVNRNIKWILNE